MRIGNAINATHHTYGHRSRAFSRLLSVLFVSSLVILFHGQTSAQTTDYLIGQGIGTFVADAFGNGSNVQINTSIESVTYSTPVRVHRGDLNYFEVTGSIRGKGWGGEFADLSGPAPVLSANAHYSYDLPFVLRWADKWDGTLVYYGHGRGNLGFLAFADMVLAENNEGRRLEEEGRYVSDAVLMPDRGYAFFALNLNGLKREGAFSVIALEGPFDGQPLMAVVDVPVARDTTLLAKLLLAKLAGKPVQHTIGTGHSGGALVMQFINGGASTTLDQGIRVFTGGNFIDAYDPTSGLIFDGVIPIAGGLFRIHPNFPMTAPMMMVSGEADYSAVDSVLHAFRLLNAGVDIRSKLWLYQVRNLTHNFAEINNWTPNLDAFVESLAERVPSADGDRMKPVIASLIENMAELLKRGTAPPRSRFDGQGVDTNGDSIPDVISFPQANGLSTQLFPFVDDPAIDTFLDAQFPTNFPGVTVRYLQVLAALEPEPGLTLPRTSCRLGGFVLSHDARLVPFEDFFAHWKNKGEYKACVIDTMNGLSKQRLYDHRLGEETLKDISQ